eukprot:753747-Hanusia_phi.AAC.1
MPGGSPDIEDAEKVSHACPLHLADTCCVFIMVVDPLSGLRRENSTTTVLAAEVRINLGVMVATAGPSSNQWHGLLQRLDLYASAVARAPKQPHFAIIRTLD